MTILRSIQRRALWPFVRFLPNGAARWLHHRAKGPLRGAVAAQIRPQDVEIDGLRFRLHPADNMSEQSMWSNDRLHEPRSVDQLRKVIGDPNTLVFDIGANAGTFTVPLARALGPGGKIVAIEPNPEMIARLRHNLQLNGSLDRVETMQAALSDTRGTTDLHIYAYNMGEASLRRGGRGTPTTIRVETHVLRDLIEARDGFDRIVVKMDVEGLEDRVLRSVLEDGKDCPIDHLLLETQHSAEWSDPLLDRLASFGFETVFTGEGNTFFSRR